MREKLIELLNETFDKQYERNLVITARVTADFLIANGVTVPTGEIDFDYNAEDMTNEDQT